MPSRTTPSANGGKEPKAFQFIQGRPDTLPASQLSNKENRAHSPRGLKLGKEDEHGKPFPSTPATRIPLADLIGDIDDTHRELVSPNDSPEEHIQWHTESSPRFRGHSPSKTVKRSRSSSPHSSALRDQSIHFTKRLKIHDDATRSAVGTTAPQIDPTSDMWIRYTSATIKNTTLNSLLDQSSPQSTHKQNGNVSGLRRWTSCGVAWPKSAKKSKPLTHTTKEHLDDVLVDDDIAIGGPTADGEAKKAKIDRLLGRIQEHLTRSPSRDRSGPSSSSPLLERKEMYERPRESEIGAVDDDAQLPQAETAETGVVDETECAQGLLPGGTIQQSFRGPESLSQRLASGSSNFGSDDLDLENIDIAFGDTGGHQSTTFQAQELPTNSHQECNIAADNVHVMADNMATEDDEFGEDDNISLGDFAVIASKYDRGPGSSSDFDVELYNIPQAGGGAAKLLGSSISDDNFEDDDIDEASFAAAEAAATQSGQTKTRGPISDRPSPAIQRYRIMRVCSGEYSTPTGDRCPEKVLVVESDETKVIGAITLRQSWVDTRCTKDSYVHIIGKFSSTGQCLVDDAHNMLILHPDHLISALVVADSFGCLRRAVLQDRVQATSESSPPQVYGTMLHEIFQAAIEKNRWESEWLSRTIQTITAKHIEDLYEIKLSVPQVVEHLQSKMPELQAWAQVFVQATPGRSAMVKDRNGKQIRLGINKLLDVEEHVWSPMYGLKGNIDATIQVTMIDDEGERTLTVPFELKTGRNATNASHRAQTALYTLLLSDRYDIAIAYGILFYLETSEMSRIPAIRHELRHMIMQRNELACYIRERLSLPPMLKNPHQCTRCYAKTTCFLYHKLLEDGDGETSGMRNKFDDICRHLKPNHQSFFKKWDQLLTQEEGEIIKFRRELWTMTSIAREKVGRCFANVVLDVAVTTEDTSGSKISRFRYVFKKFECSSSFSFHDSQIAVGEPIIISDEKGHFALAKGYVTELRPRSISVAVDRRLHNARRRRAGFDHANNQVFDGIMELDVGRDDERTECGQQKYDDPPALYRIDKDEFSSGMALVRNNMLQIMSDDVFHAKELRDLIVDEGKPRFKTASSAYTLSGPASQMDLNNDQKAALEKIMTAQDYALVLGMPGTGKTTTIAHIIRALVANGKSVLLTSYTHTAVDNILLKIRQDKISVLRLGPLTKIHPEVKEFAILGAEPKQTIEELEEAYQKPQVVATTCLGINHQIFHERIFDYCIVDEASQITLPVCLGPIRMARTFVLVGDHYQLPPLVQNKAAQEGGLDVSLFKLLSERHPSAITTLSHQYRMNAEIMSVSNTLIYNGQLKCGSESVAVRQFVLPSIEALSKLHHHSTTIDAPLSQVCKSWTAPSCWLRQAIENDSSPVLFLNTDALRPASQEKAHGSRITNPLEASLIAQLVDALLVCGAPVPSIGVIALYRSQLALVKSHLAASSYGAGGVEAHTADRFQGRDKDIIILSCVRSNDADIVGDLLRDWRRVNVAMTRARSKLIIIGSRGTLARGDALLAKLVFLCEEQKWMLDLPENAKDESVHYVITTKTQDLRSTPTRPSHQASIKAGALATNGRNERNRPPPKIGRIRKTTGKSISTRPVLADIFNDAFGDELNDKDF